MVPRALFYARVWPSKHCYRLAHAAPMSSVFSSDMPKVQFSPMPSLIRSEAVSLVSCLLILNGCGIEFTTETVSTDGAGGKEAVDGSGGGNSSDDSSGDGDTEGSGGNSSSTPDRSCSVDSDCIAVVDASDPCFNPGCQSAFGVNKGSLETSPCLLSYEDYLENQTPTSECSSELDAGLDCPALCSLQPTCFLPSCTAGQCTIEAIDDEKNCPENQALCQRKGEILKLKLATARSCTASGASASSCDSPGWLKDECLCSVPTQSANGAAFEDAKAASEEFERDCLPAPSCEPCATDSSQANVICRSNPLMPDELFCDIDSL